MKLIVGLGNPGSQYHLTRHNIGFLVVEQLAAQNDLKFKKSPSIAGVIADVTICDQVCSLLLPTTFMNKSGVAVRQACQQLDISLEDVLVIYDDFHLDFQQLRLKLKGSGGGHNGIASIIETMQSDGFSRLRVGIGSPRGDTTDFVLGEFTKEEQSHLPLIINETIDCLQLWLTKQYNEAMMKYNQRKKNE